MARALCAVIEGTEAPDLILPLPLSPQRLAERGFNQAQEIARLIARETLLPLCTTLLIRERHTHPQSLLPWKERARNVRDAFHCSTDLAGAKIALVDDVLTTGSTLHEAARALKRQGAAEVTGWVVARSIARHH
jgi:ComF family protein